MKATRILRFFKIAKFWDSFSVLLVTVR